MRTTAHNLFLTGLGLALGAAAFASPACGQDSPQPAAKPAARVTQTAQEGAQPPGNIEIESDVHDFGKRLAEDPAVIEYVPVRNTGEGPLTISSVGTSCGCVVGKMRDAAESDEPVTIPLGESRDLELRLNPAGWGGNKPTIITVRSDDPDTPEVSIRMKAEVTSAIRIDPSPVAFGERPKDETQEMILKVAGRSENFEVYAATVAGSQAFEVETLETTQVERNGKMVGETQLKVTLLPNTPVGDHQGLISLRTTDRARRLHSVAVTASVTGDLEFDLPRIQLDPAPMGESSTQTFRLTNRAGEPFKILEVEERDETGRSLGKADAKITKLSEEEGDVGYEVEVTITAQRPRPGGLSGEIVFTTDLPLEEKTRIRYLGRILPAGTGSGADGQESPR